MEVDGAGDHWDHRTDDDHYKQPGDLFRLMTPEQQQVLFDNTARQISGASTLVQERQSAIVPRPIRPTALV